MERLDRLSQYFNEKEKKRLTNALRESNSAFPVMSLDEIRLSCLENNGYESPELNDKLYLHFRGFKKIENLEAYTGCKALWLDSNGFDKIENLDALEALRCLYLSKNLISAIGGLQCLTNLHTLDLSYNRITFISNLSCCPNLNTINLSRNAIASPDAIAHLQDCLKLCTIDLTHNYLEADEKFFDIFPTIPSMTTLSINGNEITKLAHFRKRMIAANARLGYLDRPIEEVEKIGAKAFLEGGADAELAARNEYRENQCKLKAQEQEQYREWQREQRRIREKEKEEGRAQILKFTDEEIAQRAAEAKAAAEAERQMLEIGIDKVAARYWQLDSSSSSNGNGLAVLEEATRQLVNERDATNDTAVLPLPPSSKKLAIEEIDEDEEQEAVIAVPPPPPTQEELEAIAAEEARKAKLAAEAEAEAAAKAAAEAEALAKQKEEQARQLAEKKRLQAEENERQQRVAESFRIYKAQLEAEKKQKSSQSIRGTPSIPSSKSIWDSWENNDINITAPIAAAAAAVVANGSESDDVASGFKSWESAAEILCADNRPSNTFYWTEAMDMKLAQEVRMCVFDFEAVASKLQAACLDGELIVSDRSIAEKFTSESCRLRWAQLSTDQWTDFDRKPEPAAIYKVCIPKEMLSHGHGGQPTFDQLSRMSNRLPSYLKAPTALPSVNIAEDDDEDEDSDAGEGGSHAPAPLPIPFSSMRTAYAAAADETKDSSALDTSYEELD